LTKSARSADVIIIGGGLAGCEAAWQVASSGINVTLYEMRPIISTGAHVTADLAELVCSNSLGSNLPDRASGILKQELRLLGSLLLQCAEETAVPAGGALAVDRLAFSQLVTNRIASHPNIQVIREEVKSIPDGIVVIASGPLSSSSLSLSIQEFCGSDNLFFYDAISPIVEFDSINMDIAYRVSRSSSTSEAEGDYINCPFTRDQYNLFVDELLSADRIKLKEFETEIANGVRTGVHRYFEGCLPVEILAERGNQTLAYGPMRPIGLVDPRTGKRPYAVVQLRQDDIAGSLYNIVGFQTNLTFPEQRRIFRMIPGLEKAHFARYGQMHRNTFIYSPATLYPSLQAKKRGDLFFAGQITGIEGYAGNIASGLLAGQNAARLFLQQPLLVLPQTTMLGALCHYVSHASERDFQPMKANIGILQPLEFQSKKIGKFEKGKLFASRSSDVITKIIHPVYFA
jgi:methylenetetrahydrofolate--tRNA-(uracil-5-)-methyltransferase